MADRYRTTISAVYWTEDPDRAEEIAEDIRELIPDIDQPRMLTTIEYIKAGRPPVPPLEGESPS